MPSTPGWDGGELDLLTEWAVAKTANRPIVCEYNPDAAWLWSKWRGTVLSLTASPVLLNMGVGVAVDYASRELSAASWSMLSVPPAADPLIASLNGHVEASVDETGRDRRRFGPGELLLAEDTRGRGHNTKSLDGVGRWSVFIALGAPGPLGWLWAPLSPREKVLLYLAAAAGLWRLGRRWRGGGGVVKQEGAAAKAPACA